MDIQLACLPCKCKLLLSVHYLVRLLNVVGGFAEFNGAMTTHPR